VCCGYIYSGVAIGNSGINYNSSRQATCIDSAAYFSCGVTIGNGGIGTESR
jgi:hypothetical protein